VADCILRAAGDHQHESPDASHRYLGGSRTPAATWTDLNAWMPMQALPVEPAGAGSWRSWEKGRARALDLVRPLGALTRVSAGSPDAVGVGKRGQRGTGSGPAAVRSEGLSNVSVGVDERVSVLGMPSARSNWCTPGCCWGRWAGTETARGPYSRSSAGGDGWSSRRRKERRGVQPRAHHGVTAYHGPGPRQQLRADGKGAQRGPAAQGDCCGGSRCKRRFFRARVDGAAARPRVRSAPDHARPAFRDVLCRSGARVRLAQSSARGGAPRGNEIW